jgi:hypothetical protein
VPERTSLATGSMGKAGRTAASESKGGRSLFSSASQTRASEGTLCIFQFPATNTRRMGAS